MPGCSDPRAIALSSLLSERRPLATPFLLGSGLFGELTSGLLHQLLDLVRGFGGHLPGLLARDAGDVFPSVARRFRDLTGLMFRDIGCWRAPLAARWVRGPLPGLGPNTGSTPPERGESLRCVMCFPSCSGGRTEAPEFGRPPLGFRAQPQA